jgi:hypothetical protein
MGGEIVAVLEVELGLARFFHRHGQHMAATLCFSRHICAILLVYQNATGLLWYSGFGGSHEGLVDNFLRIDDLWPDLVWDRVRRAEQVPLERPSVVEGQEVKRLVIPEFHLGPHFPSRDAIGAVETPSASFRRAHQIRCAWRTGFCP